jgi:hypothetical protein
MREQRIVVRFEGPGSGVGELTWGQRSIWTAMQANDSSLTMAAAIPVTDGRTAEDLAAELRFLMCRYEAMRLRPRFDDQGRPLQAISASGETTLRVIDVDDEAGGGGVAVMMPQLADRDLTTGQAKTAATAVGPLELAREQRGPAAQVQSDRSLRYWERLLRAVEPQRVGPATAGDQDGPENEDEPRYREAVSESPAMYRAERIVAARTGVTSATVALAAYLVALARLTGVGRVAAQTLVSNRFRPGLADVSHCVFQNGLLLVDVADATFDEVVDRTRRASMQSSEHAYYDPTRLAELRARIERERGPVDIGYLFNHRRQAEETLLVDAAGDSATPTGVTAWA